MGHNRGMNRVGHRFSPQLLLSFLIFIYKEAWHCTSLIPGGEVEAFHNFFTKCGTQQDESSLNILLNGKNPPS